MVDHPDQPKLGLFLTLFKPAWSFFDHRPPPMDTLELDLLIKRQQERLAARDESALAKDLVHSHIWRPDPQDPRYAVCTCGARGVARQAASPAPGPSGGL